MGLNIQVKLLRGVLFITCFTVALISIGQPTDPSGDPDTVPITGLELLLGAGALLGTKRILDKRKGNQSSNL